MLAPSSAIHHTGRGVLWCSNNIIVIIDMVIYSMLYVIVLSCSGRGLMIGIVDLGITWVWMFALLWLLALIVVLLVRGRLLTGREEAE